MQELRMDSIISPAFVKFIKGLRQELVRDSATKSSERSLFQRYLWIAEIRPVFMEPSCLAMLLTAHYPALIFVAETRSDSTISALQTSPNLPSNLFSSGPMKLEKDWDDPVAESLKHMSAWDAQGFGGLDGVSYSIFAHTFAARTALSFSNPRTPSLVALEESLFQVAEIIMARDATGFLNRYVEGWKKYLAVTPSTAEAKQEVN